MNIATWSVRQPIPAIVAFMLMMVAGFITFPNLPVQDMPDMDLPAVTVTAVLQGASPSQLETEVTRKIENAVASLGDIEHITSTVSDGSSSTVIQFQLGKDIFEALNDVRAAVANTRAELPTEMDEPVVNKINTAGLPLQTFSVSSDSLDEEGLSWFVDNTVTRALLAVKGMGRVSRIGGVNREIRVDLDPAQLNALNISAAEVSRQLRKVQQQLSGGRAEIGSTQQSMRTIATVSQASELAELDIGLSDGRHIRLDQIATIHDTVAERTQLALLNDKPVVAFKIERARGHGSVEVADRAQVVVDELVAANPNIRFELVSDSVSSIRHEYEASMKMLYEGAFLAVLVVFIFLRDWRATLISATALPLSIVPTFAAMYLLGFSMNVITMMALSLVIGLLVDDAIVEVENIVRHLREGKSPMQAAMDAATEIGLAVIATSMALVAVFLPTAFLGGIPGLFFKQFGWTAVFAVLFSLAVARTITPMLASRFLSGHQKPAAKDGRIMVWYMDIVAWSLRHRPFTMFLATAFFAGSLALIPLLPQDFVPSSDRGQSQVQVELPPGATLEDTHKTVNQILAILSKVPEIDQVFAYIGSSGSSAGHNPMAMGGGAADTRKATLAIELKPATERQRSQTEIENSLRESLQSVAGARFTMGFGMTGEKVELMLSGDDPVALATAAQAVERQMRGVPGLGTVSSSASLLRPEIMIEPNFARAAELGVTTSAIGETVHVATSGDYGPALAKLNLPERQLDIRVQLPQSVRRNLDDIRDLRVPGRYGLVPLSSVAKVYVGSGPAQISRYDRSRNISIDAELGGLALGDTSKLIAELPAVRNLPVGVKKLDVGDTERMVEMMSRFGLAMITGILCVYTVLVLLFHNFLQPITILAALPLSVGGAFTALLLGGQSLSMPALMGLLLLMGLASKNSILLVEYAIVAMRDHGMNEIEALTEACQKRARPIVMTTLAMMAGMAPVALGVDPATAMRAPMAVAVIGGLLTSTVLSLVVVPVVFTYILRVERLLGRLFRFRRSDGHDSPAVIAPGVNNKPAYESDS